METIFCAQSAFCFYRTPPQVLSMCPTIETPGSQAERIAFATLPSVLTIFGAPLHLLIFNRNQHTSASNIKRHLWNSELPRNALVDVPGIGTLTSPAFTLFLLAREVDAIELAMAMYEFCGEFSIYEPSPEIEDALKSTSGLQGWTRVIEDSGKPSSLWMRPPLTTREELEKLSSQLKGTRGCRTFDKALGMLFGVTRSPFEAQTAMLLGTSRSMGGYGLLVETNKTIPLTTSAKRLGQRSYCVADLYVESPDGTRCADVECQGKAVHSSLGAAGSDADRTTAIESMGIDVVLVSYSQITSTERLRLVVELISEKLGMRFRPKTARQAEAETFLRSHLFIDWRTICDVKHN